MTSDVDIVHVDILHVDMDAFFAAVEVLDDASLVGRPVIVGGLGARGVVAACTYEARAFGVHSGMPMARARRACPAAVFLSGRHARYEEVSRALHRIFADISPGVEAIALDEAFIDVSGAHRILGSSEAIAHALRARVRAELGLACSIGVARTKQIAKLASRAAKPVVHGPHRKVEPGRGVVVVTPEEEIAFLTPLPVRALWGVGPATERRLSRMGIETVGQVAAVDARSLERLLGRVQGRWLAELAHGRDTRPVVSERGVKSISHEQTFATDFRDHAPMRVHLVRLADAVARRARAGSLAGRTIVLKVRFADLSIITRRTTVERPTADARVLLRHCAALLETVDVSSGVRLVGVGLASLSPAARCSAGAAARGGAGDGPRVGGAGDGPRVGGAGDGPRVGGAEAAARGGAGDGPRVGGAGDGPRVGVSGISPGLLPGASLLGAIGAPPDGETGTTPRLLPGAPPDGETGATPRLLPGAPPYGETGPQPDSETGASLGVAIDEVRRRFGPEAVGPASLVGAGGPGLKRRGDTQWGPGAEATEPAVSDPPPPGQPLPQRAARMPSDAT